MNDHPTQSKRNPHGNGLSRRPGAHALAVAAAFLLLYLLTTSYTVIIDHDDAAEFQTVGVAGGIAHQPYPLWSILARTISVAPVGEPAFRITLLSILFGVGTIYLLFRALTVYYGCVAAAYVGSAALGLSYSFWQNAVVAEVYTISTFLIVAVVYAWKRFIDRPAPSRWFALALLAGFMVLHHQLNIALIPAFLGAAIWNRKHIREAVKPAALLGSVALFLLPFSLLAYTVAVDRGPAPMNWLDNYGRYIYEAGGGDPDAFTAAGERLRFQLYVGRLGRLLPTVEEFARRAFDWGKHVGAFEFPLVGTLLAGVGFVAAAVRSRATAVFWVAWVAPVLVMALSVNQGGLRYTYSLPNLIAFAFLIARGYVAVRNTVRWPRVAGVLIGVAVIALPFVQFMRYAPADPGRSPMAADRGSRYFFHLQSSNHDGRRYGRAVDERLPDGSLVFAAWPEANVLFYHKYVLNRLAGIEVSYTLPLAEQVAAVIEARAPDPGRIYFTEPPDFPDARAVEEIPLTETRALYRVVFD